MNTTSFINSLKVSAAVLATAAALFFGYSVISYVTDSVASTFAVGGATCCTTSTGVVFLPISRPHLPHADGGGGGGGGFDPYCTVTVAQTSTHQYTFTWTAPYATSFSIDNGVGSVTPATGGMHLHTTYAPAGVYTGTALTPYGTVTCQTTYTPPPNPPYCSIIATPPTIAYNATSTITWNTSAGNTFSINNGVGALTPVGGGTVAVSPATTTTYIGTVVGNDGTATCTTTVTVTPPPPPEECKLELTKTANKTTIAPDETVEYTITVKNAGNKKCTGSGVKLIDTLDTNLVYVSETHSTNITASYSPDPVYTSVDRTIHWNAWDMDPDETGWVKVVAKGVTPTTCSVVVPNKAKITSYEYNNFTTWVESNVVNVTLAKDCTPPPPEECKLEIIKSTGDDRSYAPNETVEYTITVKNIGTKKCTGSGVKIEDVLDARLTYQSETHSSNITASYGTDPVYTSSNRTLHFNGWELDPNESGWIKFVAKVGTPTSCTETIPNKARVTSYEYNNFMTWVESNTVDISVTKDCHVPVPYCTMSADGSTISWNSTNTTSATIDQGIGSVALSGSMTVSPSVTTTYTGTFTGPGGTVTCNTTITKHTTPVPQCTISLSASTINSGQSVMVSWTSLNVTQGTVSMVGTTTPVSGGSAEVFPADSMTFVGNFSGSYGNVTCSVPITVQRGGGGCSGNCGGGLNQPNVVMLQKPAEAPLAFVTLEQIPYTGFEAGKALTLAFWLSVGLLAAVATYFAMGHSALQFVLGNAVSAAGIGRYDEYTERDTRPRPVPGAVVTETRDTQFKTNGYAATVASVPTFRPMQPVQTYVAPAPVAKPAVDGIPELADVVESRAHGAGVLISPEAVTSALSLSKDRGEVLRVFGEILNEAVRVLPREDGWVMLTSERFDEIAMTVTRPVTLATPTSTPSVEAILNSVMPPVAPSAKTVNVEMPMTNTDDQLVVMALAHAILTGDRDQAYTTLRNLETARANAASVMTVIAGAVDQLFRARKHGLTTELTVAAIDLSDEKLTKIVEVFTHGMDATYSNPFTSLKLAVAQAFEARG